MQHLGRLTLIAAAMAVVACAAPPTAPLAPQVAQGVPGMDADVLYRLGRYFHGQQKYDQALRVYAQVLAVDPGHADALNATGVIHSLRGEPQLAEAAFRRAIAEAPNSARGYNNLAYHLIRSGKPSEAITLLERARSLDGRDEQVQVNIAMARHMLDAPAVAQETAAPATPSPAPSETVTAVATAPTPNVELRRVNDGIFELRQSAVAAVAPAAPAAPAAVATTPAPAKAVAALAPRVEVSNGHGATGLAREVSKLAAPGARLTNNRPFGVSKSRVEYVPGAEQAARDIESRLPVAVPLMPVARLGRAGVRVLLGKDFPGHPSAALRANDEQRRVALTTTP